MENELSLESKIEALLFYKGEPMNAKKIAEALKVEKSMVEGAIENLRESKKGSGLLLLEADEKYTLGTNPNMSELLQEIRKEEISKDLSKATLETLSVIMYKSKNGVTRAEIDYIRGVNSSFILRNLSIRGLIEKEVDTQDSRRYVYKPTIQTLEYMGVSKIEELPNYEMIVNKLDATLRGNTETVTGYGQEKEYDQ